MRLNNSAIPLEPKNRQLDLPVDLEAFAVNATFYWTELVWHDLHYLLWPLVLRQRGAGYLSIKG